jgi:putative hydrolase of the HAD superfamily
MQYIKNFLEKLEPLNPTPVGIIPQVQKKHLLKAFVFDVYGTLLISDSGDIDEAEINTENLKKAMEFANISISGDKKQERLILHEMLNEFVDEIKGFHRLNRTSDKPYPEIDILNIWQAIITKNQSRGRIKFNGNTCIRCLTFVFEILSNRIYPMPGMHEVIKKLAEKEVPLGIVSNAQFYTPVVMNYFLTGMISEKEYIDYFDPDITVFSYKYKRSKPDLFLFQVLASSLEKKYGLQPEDVLVIGNDMQKDVYAAHITGFRTALFAGDQKSLRLREDNEIVSRTKPDYIITDLRQLLTLVD